MTLLDTPIISHDAARHALASGDCEAARRAAMASAAVAMADAGVAELAAGRMEAAVARFQQGLRLDPACRAAFHNLVHALLHTRQLRGANFDAVRSHLLTHWHALPWRSAYQHLLTLPSFLNVEFVKGKCNLKCRMCIGTNSRAHPDRLAAISVEDFERMLRAAPTIGGVTLSSGDSDPLLHPHLMKILEAAARQSVTVDLYTNGLPLSARAARAIISLGAVSMINFSVDAACAETYAVIRGGNFEKLCARVRMFSEMRAAEGTGRPMMSCSFVAMRDNIEELPSFVDWAADHGAAQVIVDDLSGWLERDGGNFPATDHPNCSALLHAATARSQLRGLRLNLHERLQRIAAGSKDSEPAAPGRVAAAMSATFAAHLHDVVAEKGGAPADASGGLACCGWIDGVWVAADGRLDPCCMVQGVADMGRIQDGPLHENERYQRTKDALLSGRVFSACRSQRMCAYVQQQKARGVVPGLIDAADFAAGSSSRARVALPILS